MTIWYIPDKRKKFDACLVCHKEDRAIFGNIGLIELRQGFVCRGCLEKWIDDYLFMLKPWDKSEWEEE